MEHPDDIICRKFLNNPTINPLSNRKIEKGKGKYIELTNMCKNRGFDISSLSESKNFTIIPIPQISLPNKIITPQISSRNKIQNPIQIKNTANKTEEENLVTNDFIFRIIINH